MSVDGVTSSNTVSYKRYRKLVREADEDVEKFQDKFDDFRKTVRKLHNYSSNDTTNEKLKDYLTDFADTYNSMVKNKDSITDKSLLKQLDNLDSLIDDNAKALKKLGLKKNDDGELEFDDEKFDDDADSEQKTINSLFTGTDSFIGQAFLLMRKIDKSASDAQYIITERYYNKKVDSSETTTTTNNISTSTIDVSI